MAFSVLANVKDILLEIISRKGTVISVAYGIQY
jgi:hypothetical protein